MFFSFFSLPPIDLHLVSKHWAASANLWHWLFLLWPAFQVLLPQSFESMLLNISIQKASLLQSCLFYAASFSLCLSVQMRLGKISLLAALKFSQNIQFAPEHFVLVLKNCCIEDGSIILCATFPTWCGFLLNNAVDLQASSSDDQLIRS